MHSPKNYAKMQISNYFTYSKYFICKFAGAVKSQTRFCSFVNKIGLPVIPLMVYVYVNGRDYLAVLKYWISSYLPGVIRSPN